MNLRTKFHLASSLLILTVVVGMMISLFVFEKKRLATDMERQQFEDLDKFARVCEDSMIIFDEPAVFKYAKNLVSMSSPKLAYAGVVYDNNGMGSPWVWTLRSDSLKYLEPSDAGVMAVQKSGRIDRRELTIDGERIIEISKPVSRIGYVRLGFSRDVVESIFRQTITRSIQRFAWVGFIAIVFGLILAQLFSAALSQPIQNLMKGAEAIAGGQKGVQLPVTGADELGRLTKTFNHMSQELIKLDHLKDDFMSHVTHELRSPLTSIIATVELMAEMPIAAKDPKFRRSIDRLIFGSERLNRLVDNILDLTRMEAGKMPFDIQPTNICKIVCEMADFFEPRAMEKGLKIQAIVPNTFPMVLADSERIRQVISNLVHNAVKFTNKGGIVLWVKEVDGVARIGVQDTGVGIPADKLGSVFKKFETLKHTRDTVDKPVPGSGLGLNIVQNSIKAQGGAIWVESEMGKGSTFIFTLPLAQNVDGSSTPTNQNEVDNRLPDASKGRHLVVIDSKKKEVAA